MSPISFFSVLGLIRWLSSIRWLLAMRPFRDGQSSLDVRRVSRQPLFGCREVAVRLCRVRRLFDFLFPFGQLCGIPQSGLAISAHATPPTFGVSGTKQVAGLPNVMPAFEHLNNRSARREIGMSDLANYGTERPIAAAVLATRIQAMTTPMSAFRNPAHNLFPFLVQLRKDNVFIHV